MLYCPAQETRQAVGQDDTAGKNLGFTCWAHEAWACKSIASRM